MKYDFTSVKERRNTDSLKWSVKEGELPMWVADMDFSPCPEIKDALLQRLDGVYGYQELPEEFYRSIKDLFSKRLSTPCEDASVSYATGVVPIVSSAVRAFTKEGESIVLLSPVYQIFYHSIENNKRRVEEVPLLFDGERYSIDWERLEQAFAKPETRMMIFCNPHNPVSKIWSQEELERIGQLAAKYDVFVLSDEIHGLLTRPGVTYHSYLSIPSNRKNSLVASSVTKAFNLAGIQTSFTLSFDQEVDDKISAQLNIDECNEPNLFSATAMITALEKGMPWLDELREVIFSHRDYVEQFFQREIPSLHLIQGDATYLLWIDISKMGMTSDEFVLKLREETGLILTSGKEYGTGGEGFVRMNIATNKERLDDGLSRLRRFVNRKELNHEEE